MKNENANVNKILVIRLSSLGDIILTTPLIKKLKQNYPEAQIDYCTKTEYADVLRNNPSINNIIEADNNLDFSKLRALKKGLIKEHYDLVIDAHNKPNTFYLRLFTGSMTLKLRKYSIRKFLLVNFKINLMKNLPPMAKRYITPLLNKQYLRFQPGDTDIIPEIFTGTDTGAKAVKFIEQLNQGGKKVICINPSSKHFTKSYPAEMYSRLINLFDKDNFCFVLTGKGSDKESTVLIKSKTGNNVYDFCNKLNIPELFELIKACSLFISGDTGPMHIASPAGVPLIFLAGSSVKEFGFYPQTNKAVILENNNLSCRPCSHIGRDNCPKGHFKCMREITPEEIKNTIESLLLVK